jgi:hypothetical protein
MLRSVSTSAQLNKKCFTTKSSGGHQAKKKKKRRKKPKPKEQEQHQHCPALGAIRPLEQIARKPGEEHSLSVSMTQSRYIKCTAQVVISFAR